MRNRHGKSLLGTWSSFGKDKTGRIKNTAHKIIISSKPRKRRKSRTQKKPGKLN
jgi:hypothetical protein